MNIANCVRFGFFWLASIWGVFLLVPGWAEEGYDALGISNGVRITGRVSFIGSPPELTPHKTNLPECGHTVEQEILILSRDKGIKNVVVSLEGVAKAKPAPASKVAVLDNRDCRFVPHILALNIGSVLEIRNSDPILHNAHGHLVEFRDDGGAHGKAPDSDPHSRLRDVRTLFNVALPPKARAVRRRLREPGLVHVMCNAGHGWMSAFIVIKEHSYFAVTDDEGRFEIADVPPGSYRLAAWHELLGLQTKQVKISEGAAAPVDFQFSWP